MHAAKIPIAAVETGDQQSCLSITLGKAAVSAIAKVGELLELGLISHVWDSGDADVCFARILASQ